jgi:hypothetical protein
MISIQYGIQWGWDEPSKYKNKVWKNTIFFGSRNPILKNNF